MCGREAAACWANCAATAPAETDVTLACAVTAPDELDDAAAVVRFARMVSRVVLACAPDATVPVGLAVLARKIGRAHV